jgi:hypothetical protein
MADGFADLGIARQLEALANLFRLRVNRIVQLERKWFGHETPSGITKSIFPIFSCRASVYELIAERYQDHHLDNRAPARTKCYPAFGVLLTLDVGLNLTATVHDALGGAKRANVIIPSNDPDESPVNVSLSGTGTP